MATMGQLAPRLSGRGFTIIELLIVIVVIGILATITIVAFNGAQQRAQNAALKTAAQQFSKGMQLWSISSGKKPEEINAGWNNGGQGYVSKPWENYSTGLVEVIASSGYLPPNFGKNLPIIPSSSTDPVWQPAAQRENTISLMFYVCNKVPGKYVTFYYLHNPSAQEKADFQTLLDTCYEAHPGGAIQGGMQGGFLFWGTNPA